MSNKNEKEAKKSDYQLVKENRALVANALDVLFQSDYISRRKLYFENFVRGMFFAVGGVVGVTLGLGLILWFLSLFNEIPLIGPIIDTISDQIQNGSNAL